MVKNKLSYPDGMWLSQFMLRDTLFPHGNTMFEMFTGLDNPYFENMAYLIFTIMNG